MSAKVKDYFSRLAIIVVLLVLLVAATPVPVSVGIGALLVSNFFLFLETFL